MPAFAHLPAQGKANKISREPSMLSSEGLLVVGCQCVAPFPREGRRGGREFPRVRAECVCKAQRLTGSCCWDSLVFLWIPHCVSHLYHRWFVFDTETKDLVTVHTDGNEQLSVMRYSPGQIQLPLLTNSAALHKGQVDNSSKGDLA